MKGRGERKKKEGRKARKRVPSPSRCCSLPLPQVRPSLSARTHARQIFYNRKKKRERERNSLVANTQRARTHTITPGGGRPQRPARPSVLLDPASPASCPPERKKTTTTTTKAPALRGSGEAGQSPPSLSSSPPFGFAPPAPEASCLPVPFFCSHVITAPAAATTCPCRRHWLAGRVLNSLVSGTPRWTS